MDIHNLTVTQIKNLLAQKQLDHQQLLQAMAKDHRSTVRKLYHNHLILQARIEKNNAQAQKMWQYQSALTEQILRQDGIVAGVDEVGRGPLAGPVLVAAVILKTNLSPMGLADSKKISHAGRVLLDVKIKNMALDWAIGMATVTEIEQLNIHHASLLAMQRAVQNLKLKPDLILVDGKFIIPRLKLKQHTIVGGDGLCPSIAAASVVAKVTRDRLMGVMDLLYPQYGFNQNKGYGTAFHLRALQQIGPCPIHRRGFKPIDCAIDKSTR